MWHTCEPGPRPGLIGPDLEIAPPSHSHSRIKVDSPKRMGMRVAKMGLVRRGPEETPAASKSRIILAPPTSQRSFQERVRRRTDLWVTRPLVVYTRTSIAGQQHAALCPSSCSHNPYSFKSATICCHNQYHFKFIQPIPITVPALPTIH